MKVVAVTDKKGSAIDRLARMNADRLPHLRYTVLPLHPKRPTVQEVAHLLEELQDADLVDVQYWKSGVTMRLMPELADVLKDKPMVLTHHNEHNIIDTDKDHWPWKDMEWDRHVCKNGWQQAELRKLGIEAKLIRHSVDWSTFSFVEKLTHEKVVGYVGQIKKVKGVKQIAQACKELGYKLLLIGSVSEGTYWEELERDFEDVIVTRFPGTLHVPDNEIGFAYHSMRAYCANSDDGTESGTMPILEAMASGVPVVTRKIGLVRDRGEHQKNMWIRQGRYDDVEDLKAALKMVVENEDISNNLREAAWRTVRQYHPDIQAREYEVIFRQVLYPNQVPVSVIMPTAGRNAQVFDYVRMLSDQSYKNFELVVCDDNEQYDRDVNPLLLGIKEARKVVRFPIKYVCTEKREPAYGLAKARNLGVIEATGDILVFCDDRLRMHPQAIEAFARVLVKNDPKSKLWVWGSKGQFKTFVENFSATWRSGFIKAGMFNERIDRYGGMTQELSARFNAQGYVFEFCPQALAEPAFGTHSKSRHREDIVASKVQLYKMGFQ